MPADRLLTTAEICNYLSVKSNTLRRLRAEGILRVYRIRTMIRYNLDEVLTALARADEEYGLRKREALIPSGGPRNKTNAMFNGHMKGLCNLNTVDLVEHHEKEDSEKNSIQRKEHSRTVKGVQRNHKDKETSVRSAEKRKRGRPRAGVTKKNIWTETAEFTKALKERTITS